MPISRSSPLDRCVARAPGGWERTPRARASSAMPRAPCSPRGASAARCACRRRSIPRAPTYARSIVVHPPGGIVGGDSLAIGIDVGVGAHAQLTTPGAAKWYRSTGSRRAVGHDVAHRAPAPLLEWLPQETMLFDGAHASIALAHRARAGERDSSAGTSTCLGRTASGERFASEHLRQSTRRSVRDGGLLFCERAAIDGGGRVRSNPVQSSSGAPVFGTLRRRRARSMTRHACFAAARSVANARRAAR
mgnify:CR=1 FL=1